MNTQSPTLEKGAPPAAAPAIAASAVDEGHRTVAAPFGHALVELARHRPEIVGMSADLAKYTDIHIFAQAYPDRFYQMGMSEQLMATAAGGLAKEGFIPFATTYATFAARRCYDFLSQAVAEQDVNVNIIGGLPGLTTGYGPSHQGDAQHDGDRPLRRPRDRPARPGDGRAFRADLRPHPPRQRRPGPRRV
jgi:transketolase